MKKIVFMLLGLAIMLNSCSQDNEISSNPTTEENNSSKKLSREEINKVVTSKEISIAIARVLSNNPELKFSLTDLVNKFDDFGDFVSLASLFGYNQLAPQYEKDRINELGFDFSEYPVEQFKTLLREEVINHADEYQYLINIGNGELNFEILSSLDLSLFFPYLEEHNWEILNEFAVSYENNSEADIQEAFTVRKGTRELEQFEIINDDQVFKIATLAITPLEDFYNYGKTLGPIKWNPDGGFTKVELPPLQGNRKLLTQNYRSDRLGENSILETNIPKIRITNNDWKRNLSSSLRMSFTRASSKLAINSNGTYTAVADSYHYYKEFSGKNLRKAEWVDVHWQWDPNWTATEASQQIIVLNRRSNAGTASVSANVQSSVNAQGQYTSNVTTTVTYTATEPKTILRGNREIDRDQAVSTNINGAESHNQTYNYNGINSSVRKVDLFEYFFQYYYTN